MFAFFKKLFGKADVNRDGVVDRKDAEVVVAAVKAGASAGAAKAKREVKKAGTTSSKKRNFSKKPKQSKPAA
jgi:hypothetical protein